MKRAPHVSMLLLLIPFFSFGQNSPASSPPWHRLRARLPLFAFEPLHHNAVLTPQGSAWEEQSVSAAAAMVQNDTLFLLYTAEERAHWANARGTMRLGLAFSTDGENFLRLAAPVLSPSLDIETPGGCKNPTVVRVENVYYMTYAAFDGQTSRLALATSTDLRHWKKYGLLLSETGGTNGGVILPQKINGRFVMYYCMDDIRIAYSNDLLHWFPQDVALLRPRADRFDSDALTLGPAPILVDSTIVLLYTAQNASGQRGVGLARFAGDNPTTLLARLDTPLLVAATATTSSAAQFAVSALVSWRGQYQLFYSDPANGIGRVKGRLLSAEGK